jgi:hypothetical protein
MKYHYKRHGYIYASGKVIRKKESFVYGLGLQVKKNVLGNL